MNVSFRAVPDVSEFTRAKARIGDAGQLEAARKSAAATLGQVASAPETSTYSALQKREAVALLGEWAARPTKQLFVATASAYALARAGTPEADAAVGALLGRTEVWAGAQKTAMNALQERADVPALRLLEQVAMSHPHRTLRAHAIAALGQLYSSHEAGEALERLAQAAPREGDLNAEDRAQALAALATRDRPPFGVLLGARSGLGDANLTVRLRTIELLSAHKGRAEVKAALDELTRSPIDAVARAAKKALSPAAR